MVVGGAFSAVVSRRLAKFRLKGLVAGVVVATILLPLSSGGLASQDNGKPPLPKITKIQPQEPLQFGDRIKIQVEDISLFYPNGQFNGDGISLYLNHQRMPSSFSAEAGDENTIVFTLKSDDLNLADPVREIMRQSWRDLLGSPRPTVPLSIGISYDGFPLGYTDKVPENQRLVYLKVYDTWVLIVGLIIFVGIVVIFIYFAQNSDIIRDSGPSNPFSGSRRPYSLGRTQMAWWTLLILGAFGFIYLVTGNYHTVTGGTLVLLGISAATALASVTIDATKSNTAANTEQATANEQLKDIQTRISGLEAVIAQYTGRNQPLASEEQKELDDYKESLRQERLAEIEKKGELKRLEAELTKPVSEGFWLDLITDKNGVTLHRSQILVWTIALGALFIWEIWRHLAMPNFSTELLALMGISSGTYLGFKFPEEKTD